MPLTPSSDTGAPLTISGAAHELGITVDTIRYYEKEGIAPAPGRGPDGWRRYDADALSWLAGVVMLRGTGMSVQEMREYASAYRTGSTPQERLAMLEGHRETVMARLEDIHRHLAALDAKIARYREARDAPVRPAPRRPLAS